MSEANDRRILRLSAEPGAFPEMAPWLGALQESRRELLEVLERIERAEFGQEFIDWRGKDGDDNSLGSILYHLAGVEMGWLYIDWYRTDLPEDVLGWLPFTSHDDTGRLTHVPDVPLDEHRGRLQLTRNRLLSEFSRLKPSQWDELSAPEGEDYAVTPGWIIYHLLEHEAGHRAEILRLVRKWVGRPITR